MRVLLPLLLAGCAQYRLTYGKTVEDTADSAPADTDTAADTDTDVWDTDVDTDTAQDTDTDVPTPSTCERILVYSTESGTGAGRDLGRFDGLASDPVLARWDVTVHERASDGPLTAALLEDYSQLWLFGADRDLGTALDFDEVRAIRDFVDLGAGVLVAAEHENTEESYADDVALVSELYGVSFEGSRREAADGTATSVTEADATLLAGVRTLPGFSSVSELGITDSNVRSAGKLGGVPAIAWRTDGTRIVFDRSWEGWSDDWRGTADQPVLVGNVATFLEWCEE